MAFAFSSQPQIRGSYLVLVDGENLVCRFQRMLKDGHRQRDEVVHIPDTFVWQPSFSIGDSRWIPLRVGYYTSFVGDDESMAALIEKMAAHSCTSARVVPHVYKKFAREHKTRIVDINITIDALRHAYHKHVDAILLLSGDGDFLSLIQEVMRQGVQVWLGAFSSGLCPRLRTTVDQFLDLDQRFFVQKNEVG